MINEQIHRLVRLSELLKERVIMSPEEPDSWVEILDERQKVIENLKDLADQGHSVPADLHLLVGKVIEMDDNVKVLIEREKKVVRDHLSRIERSKMARRQYADASDHGLYDDLGYSYFFDKKN
ncbi:hypothetical protein EDM56_00375 [Brevibacillus fluminis]|uniref:Flagellar protein FliT n=1 Tax=Brevibacillus fluminis TaxID=511487 RepID=A0A3M8DYM9_9BACL|nr:hypothetical protein [Brevibacillus fluminis]RNB92639.1 hypothetical protein EDM56_00375 [Brevibacillus fluminis]